jgi:translation elongation factor EF-1alpha
MTDQLVGKITHYYDKIGVAVVEVSKTIKVGDTVKIKAPETSQRETDFTQTVESMQIEHKQVKEAKKGDAIGMKVDQEVKASDEVYKVEE